jgi:DNA processing protein
MKGSTDTIRAALAWRRIPRVTPRRFWQAASLAGGWRRLIGADPEIFTDIFRSAAAARAVTRPFEIDVTEDLEAADRVGAVLLTPFDGPYPRLLREIPDAPLALYARGRLDRLDLPMVGIVGARLATRYGREAAAEIARDLSAAGLVVCSGMARGIDAAAHAAALDGPGGTIGVLGCGPEIVYPEENRRLWNRVASQGTLLTEFPPGVEPRAMNFPVRNRIIAGMSAAVIVVEAAERSGSLITARFAADFGRDVFAVPGSIHSPASRGCHALLRDGAILCRGVEDVLSEIFPSLGLSTAEPEAPEPLSGDAAAVFAILQREDSWAPDDLAEAADLPVGRLLTALFGLEVGGRARALPGGLYAAVRSEGT